MAFLDFLFSKKATGSVLGVDIGSSSLKVVQLRKEGGKAVLETYGELALGPYAGADIGQATNLSAEQITETLKDLLREAKTTTMNCGVSIPFARSLLSLVELPYRKDPAEQKTIIELEARKYIPVPMSEVQLDWFVIPEQEEEQSAFDRVEKPTKRPHGQEVLLVAIHNETIENYQTITENAGLKAEFYEIEMFSTARSSLGHGIAPVLVVDLGAGTTKMYVVERGIIRLTHLVTVGGQHITETLARSLDWEFEKAERVKRERGLKDSNAYSVEENERIKVALLSTLSRVFGEINRVLLSYGQRYNKNISRVVLSGGGASLPGLAEEAKTSLNADVEIADPFERTEAPAFLGQVLREIGPGFAVSVGLVLRKLKQS